MKKSLILLTATTIACFASLSANAEGPKATGYVRITNFTNKVLTVKWQNCERPMDDYSKWNCDSTINTLELAPFKKSGYYKEFSMSYDTEKVQAVLNVLSAAQNEANSNYDKTCWTVYYTVKTQWGPARGYITFFADDKNIQCTHN